MMHRRRLLAAAAALAATAPARAQAPAAGPRAEHVVLVHGAFADGSSYADVIPYLTRAGLKATAVQNPLTSFADDVAATKRAFARQHGPVLLVGHSYGGVVITEAGNDSRVKGLVYLAAIAPDVGESTSDLLGKYPPSPGLARIKASEGFLTLDEQGFVEDFAQDMPAERVHVLAAMQGPISAGCFEAKPGAAAWRGKPSAYAVCTQDRLVPVALQRFLAERMRATTVDLASSHAPTLSQPEAVARMIIAAA